jgi:hypothetical protein
MQLTPWIINKTSIIIIIIIVIIIIIKFNHIIYIYSLHDYPKKNHIFFIKIWDFLTQGYTSLLNQYNSRMTNVI